MESKKWNTRILKAEIKMMGRYHTLHGFKLQVWITWILSSNFRVATHQHASFTGTSPSTEIYICYQKHAGKMMFVAIFCLWFSGMFLDLHFFHQVFWDFQDPTSRVRFWAPESLPVPQPSQWRRNVDEPFQQQDLISRKLFPTRKIIVGFQ